ncbi:MAG: ABC transporter ATP-binding protein [Deltaproteobacteria bacterium]|nr:ABC transporter ATP-binding protein [Deltaproteobacteria bacterium]
MSRHFASPEERRHEPLLVCEEVDRWFGGVSALVEVSLQVERGEIFGLVGPNGSGKTTLVNTVTGFYPPQRGEIRFENTNITGMRPHRVNRLGIARTFQNLALFKGMTVLDNILLGRHTHMRPGALKTACYWWWGLKEEVRHRRFVEEVIDFLQLEGVRKEPVDILPLGLQKRVELARALVAEPKLLILDEPMAGMNQEEKEYMARFILDVCYEWGTTVLLIEHHMDVVTAICDRIAVLNYGRKIASGVPKEVISDPGVISAYLGGVRAHVADQ